MGIFDLLTPPLAWIDNTILASINIDVRLIIWSLISAIGSTLLFKWFINPQKISVAKTQLRASQKALNSHDGEFSELKSLATKTIALSLKRLGLTIIPTLAASTILVFMLVFLSSQYDLKVPEAGSRINYTITWEEGIKNQTIQWSDKLANTQTTVTWPEENTTIEMFDNQGLKLLSIPTVPVSIIHKKQWWNVLLANPAGYIPDHSDVAYVTFEFTSKEMGPIFGAYFDTWHWPFIILLSLFSIACLIIFKVKF